MGDHSRVGLKNNGARLFMKLPTIVEDTDKQIKIVFRAALFVRIGNLINLHILDTYAVKQISYADTDV